MSIQTLNEHFQKYQHAHVIALYVLVAVVILHQAQLSRVVTVPIQKQAQSVKAEPVTPMRVTAADRKAMEYIDRFAQVARQEQGKYGIPASITLAQGILESEAGESMLAKKANNHFGMKCFSKNCPKGHCINRNDDHHKDFFRAYETAWASFRAHSELLTNSRYKVLLEHGYNYKKWAHGLSQLGYATDKKYADKLIAIIEKYNLHQHDIKLSL